MCVCVRRFIVFLDPLMQMSQLSSHYESGGMGLGTMSTGFEWAEYVSAHIVTKNHCPNGKCSREELFLVDTGHKRYFQNSMVVGEQFELEQTQGTPTLCAWCRGSRLDPVRHAKGKIGPQKHDL